MICLRIRRRSIALPPLRKGITHRDGRCWRSRHFYIWTARRRHHGVELLSGRRIINGWRQGIELAVSWRVRNCGLHSPALLGGKE